MIAIETLHFALAPDIETRVNFRKTRTEALKLKRTRQ